MPTNVVVPTMGESITQAVLVRWIKSDGDSVEVDEPLCEMETDKANFDLPAPAAGLLHTLKTEGEAVHVGETIAQLDELTTNAGRSKRGTQSGRKSDSQPPTVIPKPPSPSPAERTAATPSGMPEARSTIRLHADEPESTHGPMQITQEPPEPQPNVESQRAAPSPRSDSQSEPSTPERPPATDSAGDRRVPMSNIRRRIAERLVAAQNQAAMLTTFNEIDMTLIGELRSRHKSRFEQSHGVALGIVSFFARACVLALRDYPALNAEIDGTDIVYHQHVNLGIAVSTDRGLVVPVLHAVEAMSFGQIEGEIKRTANAAREGKLGLRELSGGTFTITNGGVFGSLLSTPILNPPQTGILGMHAIQNRPIAWNGQIAIRPMMYVALTYDHRLVDGRESVGFLMRIKELVEDPALMLLGL